MTGFDPITPTPLSRAAMVATRNGNRETEDGQERREDAPSAQLARPEQRGEPRGYAFYASKVVSSLGAGLIAVCPPALRNEEQDETVILIDWEQKLGEKFSEFLLEDEPLGRPAHSAPALPAERCLERKPTINVWAQRLVDRRIGQRINASFAGEQTCHPGAAIGLPQAQSPVPVLKVGSRQETACGPCQVVAASLKKAVSHKPIGIAHPAEYVLVQLPKSFFAQRVHSISPSAFLAAPWLETEGSRPAAANISTWGTVAHRPRMTNTMTNNRPFCGASGGELFLSPLFRLARRSADELVSDVMGVAA